MFDGIGVKIAVSGCIQFMLFWFKNPLFIEIAVLLLREMGSVV